MVEAKLLARLKAEQKAFAEEALALPSNKTEFEYGQRCGHYAGLGKAVDILTSLLEEERKGDRDL